MHLTHLTKRSLFVAATLWIAWSMVAARDLYSKDMYFDAAAKKIRPLSAHVPNPKPAVLALKARPGLPVRLKIPKIKVDVAIEYVGVTPLGDMDVPSGPNTVGWFEPGPRPGEAGNAVLAGHYGWKNDTPAVFDDLYKLVAGDTIAVVEEGGTTTNFVVRAVRVYGAQEDASMVFGATDGKAHLNLITCEGVWNKSTKSYDGRLVVFADKV